MPRFARVAVAASLSLAGILFAAGCGGTTSVANQNAKAADAFVRRITVEFSRGQSGRLWDELLPSDQRVVSRGRFVECQANGGWNLKSLKVLDDYSDPVSVGTKTLNSRAVTVRVTSDDGITTATMHAISVHRGWRWILQPSDRLSYLNGTCPRAG